MVTNSGSADSVTTDLQHDLPAAWRMALAVCPYCGGTGARGTHLEPDSCGFCGDTGDLFGHLLTSVYAMGRDEAVRVLRAHYEDLVRAGRLLGEHDPSAPQLKARLGL